jgi:hypothetical protein
MSSARSLLSDARLGFVEGKSARSGALTWRLCVFLSAIAGRSAPQTRWRNRQHRPEWPHLGVRHPRCQGKHVQYIGEAGDVVVIHRQALTRLATEDPL